MDIIEGVVSQDLKVIADERGWLMEILRIDSGLTQELAQVYLTTAYPGVVKAWHYHKDQTDIFTCIKGMVKLVLHDPREGSSTKGVINEFHIGDKRPMVVKIPPLVHHGFKAIGRDVAYMINIPNKVFNYEKPDEFRLPPDSQEIPYEWILDPKLKHG